MKAAFEGSAAVISARSSLLLVASGRYESPSENSPLNETSNPAGKPLKEQRQLGVTWLLQPTDGVDKINLITADEPRRQLLEGYATCQSDERGFIRTANHQSKKKAAGQIVPGLR